MDLRSRVHKLRGRERCHVKRFDCPEAERMAIVYALAMSLRSLSWNVIDLEQQGWRHHSDGAATGPGLFDPTNRPTLDDDFCGSTASVQRSATKVGLG
jgi:hypothetical protein